jgi:hypothetical protein
MNSASMRLIFTIILSPVHLRAGQAMQGAPDPLLDLVARLPGGKRDMLGTR